MKKTNKLVLSVSLILIGFYSFALPIRDIKVKAKNVITFDSDLALFYVGSKVGMELDRTQVSRDIKALSESQRFSFVDVEIEKTSAGDGWVVTYVVEVKPRLMRPVIVLGADNIGENKVREWLELETGDAVDDAIMALKSRNVLENYKKRWYFDTRIKWDISTEPTNGYATVTVKITEGDRGSIRKLEFSGNTYKPPSFWQKFKAGLRHKKAVSPYSVPPEELNDALKERVWNIFSFITKRGSYNADELENDKSVIRRLYLEHGYLDVDVKEPQVSLIKPQRLKVVYPLAEGEQYKIGSLSIEGASIFPVSNLMALVKIKQGDVASISAIEATANAIRDHYQMQGYMRTQVKPDIKPHRNEAVVDILFKIEEGSKVFVRFIEIKGNTRTKDNVLRRELTVFPGEIYNQVEARRSERILQNLGFLDNVKSYPRETLDQNKDDIVFEVEEGRPGQFMVGAGYSSVDELLGFLELSHGNVDIFAPPYFTGGGEKLRLRAQMGTSREDYLLSFVEPWFMGRKLSLGVDLYEWRNDNLSDYYNEQRIGGALTLGKPLKTWFQRVNLKYSLERITLYHIPTNAVERIQDEKGSQYESTMRLTFIHDTRNSPFVPTSGNRTTVSGRLSGGPLDFDTDVYGFEAETISFFPTIFDHTLSVRLWVEVVDEYGNQEDVPIFDRLFLGGAQTLRGFKYRHVSPYEEDEPIGGKSAALGTIEYTIPIYKKYLRFATFYDIGNAWMDAYDFKLDEYCSDVGIGLRIDLPGFPIRFDYAWPLEISGDVSRTSARLNFWMGYGF
jgi:outer membrane protein insertion porin family